MKAVIAFPENRPSDIAPEAIWLFRELEYGYAGLDNANFLTAIYPLHGRLPLVGRQSGAIRIEFLSNVHIQVEGKDTLENCCVVTCEKRRLERSFCALIESVSRDLATLSAPSSSDLTRIFGNWEQLFKKARRLSSDEEQGLWGELHFIATRDDPERAIATWRGPSAEDYDFLSDGKAFEVKTSRRLGRHHVSHAQVAQASQQATVFLVSLWVGEDAIEGETLPEIIDRVGTNSQNQVAFEEKLLATGYSRNDQLLYEKRYRILEGPMLFDMMTVPRIRDMDPGIFSVHYTVQLNPNDQVTDTESQLILRQAFGNYDPTL